jgi:hypothetical protein
MKDTFVFYRSFIESVENLSDIEQLRWLKIIINYSLDDTEPDLKGLELSFWTQLKFSIDRAQNRYNASVENGKKGGRPKKTQENLTEPDETKNNLTKPNKTKNNLKEPNHNLNKDKDKDKDKDIDKNKDIDKVISKRTTRENFNIEKFYNSNLIEIHHIMDTLKISKEEAIDIHKDVIDSMSSVFN